MIEPTMEQWAETLSALRKRRWDTIAASVQQSGNNFTPEAFYKVAEESLSLILTQWLDAEQKSFENLTTGSLSKTLTTLLAEVESVIDFELEAIERDRESAAENLVWTESDVVAAQTKFENGVLEVRKKFQLKINSFREPPKNKPAETAAPRARATSGGSSSGGGGGVLLMFILGLLLGAAPSYYFWDSSIKGQRKFEDEKLKIRDDQKRMEDGLAVLQENFEGLATGKIRNLPQLEKEIARIRSEARDTKDKREQDFRVDKERILKRIQPGDKQDRALEKLKEDHQARIKAAEEKERIAIEPLEKEIAVLKALMVR